MEPESMDLLEGADVLELAAKLPGCEQALLAAYQELVEKRHEAWEQYQTAHLASAVGAHAEPAVLPGPGLSRPTLGDAIKNGHQERIIARWERQQQQWVAMEQLLAARVAAPSAEGLAMNRGQEWRRREEAVLQLEAASSAGSEATPATWSMSLRGANERLVPLGPGLTSGLYLRQKDPYKGGRQLEYVGRPSAASISSAIATSSGDRSASASAIGTLRHSFSNGPNSAFGTPMATYRASRLQLGGLAPLPAAAHSGTSSAHGQIIAAAAGVLGGSSSRGASAKCSVAAGSTTDGSYSTLAPGSARKAPAPVRPGSSRFRGWCDSQYLQARRQQLHVEQQQGVVPNLDGLVVQGTAAERLLLASATRTISLFELEEQLAASDQQAYQAYLVERHDRCTAAVAVAQAGPHPGLTGRPGQQKMGPWLQLASQHVLLDAAVGESAYADVVLSNVGSTVVYYHWRQAEQQHVAHLAKVPAAAAADSSPDAGATSSMAASGAGTGTNSLCSPDLAAAKASILPGQQRTVRIMFRPAAPGVFTQCWSLVTAPRVLGGPGQLTLRGLATADDKSLPRRRQLAAELVAKERASQVQLAVRVVLERVVEGAAQRAPRHGSAATSAPASSAPAAATGCGAVQEQQAAFQAANSAEWPPLYYSCETWQGLQFLHSEAAALLQTAALSIPLAPLQPAPVLPSAALAASHGSSGGSSSKQAERPQQQQEAPPLGAAVAAGLGNSGLKQASMAAHVKSQNQQEQLPEPPGWTGSVQHLRTMLQLVQQQQQQQDRQADAAALQAAVLKRRLQHLVAQAQVPSDRRQLLRHCLTGALHELAGRVAAASAQAAADGIEPRPEQSHTSSSPPSPPAAAPGASSRSRLPLAAPTAVTQRDTATAVADDAALLEQHQGALYLQRFRRCVRQGAVELLGSLEQEVAVVQEAAAGQVWQQLQALAVVAHPGSLDGAREDSSWRAFALLRALQRSKVV